jgi:hypothetical protein
MVDPSVHHGRPDRRAGERLSTPDRPARRPREASRPCPRFAGPCFRSCPVRRQMGQTGPPVSRLTGAPAGQPAPSIPTRICRTDPRLHHAYRQRHPSGQPTGGGLPSRPPTRPGWPSRTPGPPGPYVLPEPVTDLFRQ